MIIVGCDFHPSFQQVAMLDTETGASEEHKLMHTSGEAEGFYRKLASPAIVGIETVGNDQWFVQLLQKLGHEVCVGDAAQIRASYVRSRKRIVEMQSTYCSFWWKEGFHGSGYQTPRCGIIANC